MFQWPWKIFSSFWESWYLFGFSDQLTFWTHALVPRSLASCLPGESRAEQKRKRVDAPGLRITEGNRPLWKITSFSLGEAPRMGETVAGRLAPVCPSNLLGPLWDIYKLWKGKLPRFVFILANTACFPSSKEMAFTGWSRCTRIPTLPE